jgi:hypothetical protein
MASLKVVVTRSLPTHVLAETTKRLGGKVQFVTWTDESPAPRSFLLSQIKGAAGLICMLNDNVLYVRYYSILHSKLIESYLI